MPKLSISLMGGAGVLAGLAIGLAQISPDTRPAYYGLLYVILTVSAVTFFVAALVFGLASLVRGAWRYFHAVEIPESVLYANYWAVENIAQISGTRVKTSHDGVGFIDIYCHAQYNDPANQVRWYRRERMDRESDLIFEFPQTHVDFSPSPRNGDPAWVVIKAEPRWWRGRPAQRIQRLNIQLVGRVPTPAERAQAALEALNPFVVSGNGLLEQFGRPYSPGQPPDLASQGLVAMNQWFASITPVLQEHARESLGHWNNDGAVYDDSGSKAVSVRVLEGRLARLGDILTELRAKL